MTDDDIVTRAVEHLFRWNTPHDPYFIIQNDPRRADDGVDPYAPIIAALDAGGFIATEAHDLEVTAKALRDAAEAIPGWYSVPHATRNWLDDRADRIEGGDEP